MPNLCLDCSSSTTGDCKKHQQSPINLYKSVTANRPCHDWHRMHFNRGNCRWGEMRFEILPHVLRAYQPKDGCQIDPCIDFSYGFPDEWLLRYTDISVPSQHTFEGESYAAEVVMSHVNSVNKTTKEVLYQNTMWCRGVVPGCISPTSLHLSPNIRLETLLGSSKRASTQTLTSF